MNPKKPHRRPPVLAVWLVTLFLLGLSAVTAWAQSGQEHLRWTIPTYTPTPTPSTGEICVQVYHDRNKDGIRQPTTEELLAGAEVSVRGASTSSLVIRETVDQQEPLCFGSLQPDLYIVGEINPAGYDSTTDDVWGAVISANVSILVPFGDIPAEPQPIRLPLLLNKYASGG
jgi:hypothetical protein